MKIKCFETHPLFYFQLYCACILIPFSSFNFVLLPFLYALLVLFYYQKIEERVTICVKKVPVLEPDENELRPGESKL